MIRTTSFGVPYQRIYIPYADATGMLLHIIEKIHNGNIKILYYVVISILTGPHSQYLVVGQGMKQTLLYL
jgi:hypothetical protein